jgi:hypothetical protein
MCFLEDLKGHQRHNLRLDETCRDAFKIFKLTSDLSGQSSLSHAWHAHRTPFLTLETNDLLEVWCHRIFVTWIWTSPEPWKPNSKCVNWSFNACFLG